MIAGNKPGPRIFRFPELSSHMGSVLRSRGSSQPIALIPTNYYQKAALLPFFLSQSMITPRVIPLVLDSRIPSEDQYNYVGIVRPCSLLGYHDNCVVVVKSRGAYCLPPIKLTGNYRHPFQADRSASCTVSVIQ